MILNRGGVGKQNIYSKSPDKMGVYGVGITYKSHKNLRSGVGGLGLRKNLPNIRSKPNLRRGLARKIPRKLPKLY